MAFHLDESDLSDEVVLCEKLFTLASIVARKHFYASLNEREDLISVAVLKAVSLIKGSNYGKADKIAVGKKKGSLMSYIYSGMRNEMHNYMYHQNKGLRCTDVVSEETVDEYFKKDSITIDARHVRVVCNVYSCFGGGVEGEVIKCLESKGFIIDTSHIDYIDESKVGNPLFEKYEDSASVEVISCLSGVVIWKVLGN